MPKGHFYRHDTIIMHWPTTTDQNLPQKHFFAPLNQRAIFESQIRICITELISRTLGLFLGHTAVGFKCVFASYQTKGAPVAALKSITSDPLKHQRPFLHLLHCFDDSKHRIDRSNLAVKSTFLSCPFTCYGNCNS